MAFFSYNHINISVYIISIMYYSSWPAKGTAVNSSQKNAKQIHLALCIQCGTPELSSLLALPTPYTPMCEAMCHSSKVQKSHKGLTWSGRGCQEEILGLRMYLRACCLSTHPRPLMWLSRRQEGISGGHCSCSKVRCLCHRWQALVSILMKKITYAFQAIRNRILPFLLLERVF